MTGLERLGIVRPSAVVRARRRAARFERKQRLRRFLTRQSHILMALIVGSGVLAILDPTSLRWVSGAVLLLSMAATWDIYEEALMRQRREIERAAWQHERDVETMLDLSHAVDVEIHNRWKAENGLDREAILWEGQTGTGQIVDRG